MYYFRKPKFICIFSGYLILLTDLFSSFRCKAGNYNYPTTVNNLALLFER